MEMITDEQIQNIRRDLVEVDWHNVSQHYALSEDFIREFQDKVNWDVISIYQTLSEEFREEFQDRLNCIPIWWRFSPKDFTKKFKNRIQWNN